MPAYLLSSLRPPFPQATRRQKPVSLDANTSEVLVGGSPLHDYSRPIGRRRKPRSMQPTVWYLAFALALLFGILRIADML